MTLFSHPLVWAAVVGTVYAQHGTEHMQYASAVCALKRGDLRVVAVVDVSLPRRRGPGV
jgi:hypothetical protein